MNRVVLQFFENGTFQVHSDELIELYSVEERCPDDRVFRHSDEFVRHGTVDEVLGDDPVGFDGDGSEHDAVAHLIADLEPSGQHDDLSCAWHQKRQHVPDADCRQATRSNPTKSMIPLDDIDEAQIYIRQRSILKRVRALLLDYGAEAELLDAIDQALEDNEMWAPSELGKLIQTIEAGHA